MANKFIAPNEALGRFFPGGPLPKRPAKPYGSRKAIEFKDFNKYYDEFFDMLSKEVSAPITAPLKFLATELKKDFNQEGLTLTVEKPSEAESKSVPVEFADDIDDLPGSVGVQLNLNPVQWIKEPTKQAGGFLNSLVKGTFGYDIAKNTWSFTDVDNALEKDFIWDPLVKGKDVGIGRLSSTGTEANKFANLVQRKLVGKTAYEESSDVGLSDALGEGLTDFTSTQRSYVLGVGEIAEPGNPVKNAQQDFINNMGKLNSEKTRESSFTTISTGFLNVLDKQVHRDRDVSYILSAEANDLLRSRLVADSFGNVTPILDVQGNDALSSETSRLSSLLKNKKEKDEKVATLQDEINDLSVKLYSATSDEEKASIERDIESKERELLPVQAQVSFIDNSIDVSTNNLLGTSTAPGLLVQTTSTIDSAGLSPVTDKVLIDLNKSLKSASKDKKALLTAIEKGTLPTAITSTRDTLKQSADPSSTSFLFREQVAYLKRIQSFDSKFGEPLGKVSRANLKKEKVDVDALVTSLRKTCAEERKVYEDTRKRLEGNPEALREFEETFKRHYDVVTKLGNNLDNVTKPGDLRDLLSKYQSVYSTKTIGGGLKDVVTRKFMEDLYFGKGPLAKTFEDEASSDLYENSKRLFLISRNRYERESAIEWNKMVAAGPKGLLEPFVKKYVKERFGIYDFLSEPRKFVRSNILEPTHFFGMSYNAKLAEQLEKEWDLGKRGLVHRIHHSIGKPLTEFWGKNNLAINIEGLSFKTFAGAHFVGAVSLGGLLQSGAVSPSMLTSLLNAKDLNALNSIDALKGIKLPYGDMDSLNKFLAEIHQFKAWLGTEEGKRIAGLLGVSFDSAGNVLANENLSNFFRFIAKLAKDPSSTDPTQYLVGRLKLLSQFLSRLQNKWIALVAKVRKPIVYLKVLITEGITEGLLAPLEAATGGLARFLRIAIRAVVSKAVDWGELFVRGVLKFDLTDFYKEMDKTVKGAVSYILYFAIAPILIIVFAFDSVDTLMAGVSPVDNSRTDGVLLGNCGPIDDRAQGVGTCGICGPSSSIDWSPYSLGSSTFTDGIAFVLNAAANDFDIPAPLLAAVFYVEGWSENVPGKFEQPWTYDNVCDWSLEEGPLLPGCEDRTSSSDARGSFQWIPAWFEQQIEASNVASLTPIPRGEYNPCNFLDAAYAAAGRFKELGAAAGVSGCNGWDAPKGSIGGGYADGLPSTASKAQWAILHYACGAGGGECFDDTFINYSEKGLAVYSSLKCF